MLRMINRSQVVVIALSQMQKSNLECNYRLPRKMPVVEVLFYFFLLWVFGDPLTLTKEQGEVNI